MLKWLLTILLAVVLLSIAQPVFRRYLTRLTGSDRIFGDVTLTLFGKRRYFPFGSTILFSLVATLIFWLIR